MDLVAFLLSPAAGRDGTEMPVEQRGSWELGPVHEVWLQSLNPMIWEPQAPTATRLPLQQTRQTDPLDVTYTTVFPG